MPLRDVVAAEGGGGGGGSERLAVMVRSFRVDPGFIFEGNIFDEEHGRLVRRLERRLLEVAPPPPPPPPALRLPRVDQKILRVFS